MWTEHGSTISFLSWEVILARLMVIVFTYYRADLLEYRYSKNCRLRMMNLNICLAFFENYNFFIKRFTFKSNPLQGQ